MTLHHELRAAAGNSSGPATDPDFNNVSLLLHGDGTNGAQNNTFLDSSSNNFTITRYGNTTQGSLSPYGTAWSNYFDGSGDYLTLPASSSFDFGLGDFTIEGWWFINSLATAIHPITLAADSPASANTIAWFIYMDGSTKEATICSGTTYYSVSGWSSSVTLSVWQHFAFVRQSGTLRFYLNGVQVGTASANVTINSNAAWTTKIGTYTASLRPFNGYLSNIRIVKGACQYPNGATFTPPTAPLTAISGTSLLTCQSNRFKDNSSNNFTLTPYGNVAVQSFSPYLPTAAYDPAVNGGSGYFDGSGDALVTPSSGNLAFGTSNFAIEAFYYANTAQSAPGSIIGQGSDSGGLFGAIIAINSSNQLLFAISSNSTVIWSFTTSTTIPLGQWNHVCLARNGSVLSAYLNGTRVATTTNSTNLDQSKISLAAYLVDNPTRAGYIFNAPCYIASARAVKGNSVYNPSSTTITVPTSPLTAISGTSLLLNFTNAGIFDNAMKNDLETVGNAQVSTAVKKYGTGSMYFDGTGDYLTAPASPQYAFGTSDFTVEFWVYPTSAGSWNALYDQWVGSSPSYTVGQWQTGFNSSRVFIVYIATGGSSYITYTTSLSLSLNTWQHVAIVRNSGVLKAYLNGSGSTTTDTNSSAIIGLNSPICVGTQSNNKASNYTGYIDDLRITKGIAVYTANFTPPTQAFPNQ